MKFTPVGDRVLVKRKEADEVSKGGILLPKAYQEKMSIGIVTAFGRGRTLANGTVVPIDLKQGDVVYFEKYAGQELKVDGEDHVMLKYEDVMAVEEK